MARSSSARIVGLGSYLPEKILTNCDLEKMVETSDDWILSRTGMKERRIAHDNEFTSDMAIEAGKKALSAANLPAEKLDLILVATMTPDYISPSTSAIVQSKLGATHAAAMDLQAACTGFLYGLSIAKAYIESGIYQNILLIASEKMSAFVDYQDRNTCVLFGDGASAALISNQGVGFSIDSVSLGADGSLSDLLMIPAGGSRFPANENTLSQKMHHLKMNGKELFKHAVRRMKLAANNCLEQLNLSNDAIDWIIPHQANIRILEALSKELEIPSEKVFKTLHKYGNTSASSIGIALDEFTCSRQIPTGEKLLLVAFGAGLTWGASVLTKKEA